MGSCAVLTYEVCPGQELHHALHFLVAAEFGLSVGYAGIGRSPAQPVSHELNGALQNILAVVYKLFGLGREGERVQGL